MCCTDSWATTSARGSTGISQHYRNHNERGAISQEPFRWNTAANASRTAIAVVNTTLAAPLGHIPVPYLPPAVPSPPLTIHRSLPDLRCPAPASHYTRRTRTLLACPTHCIAHTAHAHAAHRTLQARVAQEGHQTAQEKRRQVCIACLNVFALMSSL